jgi:HlyD family secretion protein
VAQKPSVIKVPNAALRFRPAGVEAPPSVAPPTGAAAGGADVGGPSIEQLRELLVKELTLTPEQQKKLEPILRDTREQLRGLQGLPEGEWRSRARNIREAQRARIREILTDEQRGRYEQIMAARGQARSGVAGRVWIVGPDGKPAPIALTLGLSDGASTEVLRGDVHEGQEVIVGSAGGSGRGAQPQQGAPRLRL